MKFKISLAFLILTLSFHAIIAQNKKPIAPTGNTKITTPVLAKPSGPVQLPPGEVVYIIQNSKLDTLIERHKQLSEFKKYQAGYRIQLFFGQERERLNAIKGKFLEKYPDVKTYVTYQKPNFKLRIGDFKSRLEAFKMMKAIEKDFESLFIVKSEVKTILTN